MLVQLYNGRRVGYVAVGQLRYVYKSVLMHAYVNESPEVGDVCHDARQHHAFVQVVNGAHAVVERKLLNLSARVAPGLLKFLHYVGQRGHSHCAADIPAQVYGLALAFVGNQLRHGAAAVFRHLLHYFVALGVYGGVVERVGRPLYAQESGALLVGGGPEARHFQQLAAACECAVGLAVVHDILRQYGAESAHVGQQVLAGSVEVYAHGVDTALNGHVEAVLQFRLVNVVLVLPYADALWVELHEFGQRVHQPPPYAYRPAHGDVLVGKLLSRRL